MQKIESVLGDETEIVDKISHVLEVIVAILVVAVLCLAAWLYSSLEIM